MTNTDQLGLIEIHEEVREALDAKKPVVALESTIITHGMPWPQNHETALAVEQVVRSAGALPATIAVFGGRIHVGLDATHLKELAQAKNVLKLSRADLAYGAVTGKTGSTTVSATMMAAERAGIEVFATGGIGGVHKGAEESFDISADLGELARTNTIVVCAGAKAILDIPKTLEVLETLGVPVLGYQCSEMPAFWSRQSGLKVPLRVETALEIAAMWHGRKLLAQKGGVLVTNPVGRDDEIAAEQMTVYINQAVDDAQKAGISGKAVTPWMLSRIVELTNGQSLQTNIALIKNNARLAAEIALRTAQAPS